MYKYTNNSEKNEGLEGFDGGWDWRLAIWIFDLDLFGFVVDLGPNGANGQARFLTQR
jgi:hypothetical protein